MPDRAVAGQRRRIGVFAVPLVLFAALALMFAYALQTGDPSRLPSALIGKQAPEMNLPPVEGLRDGDRAVPGFATADLKRGEVSVVNFFASWCVPCVQEHPNLVALGREANVKIYGINYKDPSPGGRRFLGRYGNPYWAVGEDARGRAAIDWGVYGVPETFVVGRDGRIAYKLVGPITAANMERVLKPEIEKALVAPAS